MKCKKAISVMSEYISGVLCVETHAEVTAHIEDCDACASEYQATQRIVDDLSMLSADGCPVNCWAGVRERVIDNPPARRMPWQFFLRPSIAAPAFACAVLLAILLLVPGKVNQPQVSNGVPAPEYGQYVREHATFQSQQAFVDSDVTFMTAELERTSYAGGGSRR